MGITNTFANLTGFGAPYVCGLLINNDVSKASGSLSIYKRAKTHYPFL